MAGINRHRYFMQKRATSFTLASFFGNDCYQETIVLDKGGLTFLMNSDQLLREHSSKA